VSGGSLDYVFLKVEEAADTILGRSRSQTPEHVAFVKHLRLVAAALKDIEWVLSCDLGDGDDLPAIRKVISQADALDAAREAIEKAIKEGQATIRAVDTNFPAAVIAAALKHERKSK
jgi:hypothetical protein